MSNRDTPVSNVGMGLLATSIAVLVFAALCSFCVYTLRKESIFRARHSTPALQKDKPLLSRQIRAVAIGASFFFPAFLLSLPVTVTWARHEWPGDGQAVLGAFWPSVAIAVISAIGCCVYKLMRVNREP